MISQTQEKTFPIYHFILNWEEGEGSDRKKNGISDYRMYKEDPSEETLKNDLEKFKEEILKKDGRLNPVFTEDRYEFKERETWCLRWFNHYTFDLGQTDEEVVQSFERFVTRKEDEIRREKHKGNNSHYCLMGAEDRWRWESKSGSIPCRCEHCKKQGLLRIDH